MVMKENNYLSNGNYKWHKNEKKLMN